MKTLKKIGLWVGLIIVWGNLLFINWVAIGLTSVLGYERWGLFLFLFDITVAYLTLKYMGWAPKNLSCSECGCTIFDELESGDFRCNRCGNKMNHEN